MNVEAPIKAKQLAIDPRLHGALKSKAALEDRFLQEIVEEALWPLVPAEHQPEEVRKRLAAPAAA